VCGDSKSYYGVASYLAGGEGFEGNFSESTCW